MDNLEQRLLNLLVVHKTASDKFITELQKTINEYKEFLERYNAEIDAIAMES